MLRGVHIVNNSNQHSSKKSTKYFLLEIIFSIIADKVRGKAFLVAVDTTLDENSPLLARYNIEAYPTLILFKKNKKYVFKGERTMVSFLT